MSPREKDQGQRFPKQLRKEEATWQPPPPTAFTPTPTILVLLVVIQALHVALGVRVGGLLVVPVVAIEIRELREELEHVFSVVVQVGYLTIEKV